MNTSDTPSTREQHRSSSSSKDDDPHRQPSSSEMVRILLRRHYLDLLTLSNLLVSTYVFRQMAKSVVNVSAFTFFVGFPASELGHVLVLLQALNLWLLGKINPTLYSTLLAKAMLAVNGVTFVRFGQSVLEALRARSEMASQLLAQSNIPPRAGQSNALLGNLLTLVPLFAVSRRFKTLKKESLQYASLETLDPALFQKFKQSTPQERVLNLTSGRGSIGHWMSLDIIRCEESVKFPLARGSKGVPVVLYIHGGGWSIGDKYFGGIAFVQRLASRGVLCVTINYRLAPDAPMPRGVVDCKRALLWVKTNIARYGGDHDRIFLAGESAGGNLSALLGCTPDDNFDASLQGQDTRVAGVIPLYGVFDFLDTEGHLVKLHPSFNPSVYDGGFKPFLEAIVFRKRIETNRELYASCSPTHRVMRAEPTVASQIAPYLVMHGTKDALAALHDAQAFFEQLQAMRARTKTSRSVHDCFVTVTGGHHGYGYLPSCRSVAAADCAFDFIVGVTRAEDEGVSGGRASR